KAFAMPGFMSGNETFQKVRHLSARSVCEASSIDGLTPSTTPMSTRKAIGVKDKTWAIHIPVKPYSQRLGSIPKTSYSPRVTQPASLDSSVSGSTTTNGGEKFGKFDTMRIHI